MTDLLPSQWAEQYGIIPAKGNAEPGPYSFERTPYLREIIDLAVDPSVKKVVMVKSAQLGFTQLVGLLIGYFAQACPSSIMVVQPTLDAAKSFSKKKIAPMIRETPVLVGLISEPRAKDGGNTILHKEFPGGYLVICGANSPVGLRSLAIRVLLEDEVDAYPLDCGGEGSPITLAEARTETFEDTRVIYLGSTPVDEEDSVIWAAYQQSDRRKYFVSCPACDGNLVFEWERLDKKDPENPYLPCPHCGYCIEEKDKREMVARGRWIAQKPFEGTAGFAINALYSPWKTWSEIVRKYHQVKRIKSEYKSFVNTVLGLPWNDNMFEEDDLADDYHREVYEHQVPNGVVLLTAAGDMQSNRIEIEVLGWGRDDETWSIEYRVIEGDPGTREFWDAVEEYLTSEFEGDGINFRITAAAIDAGGHHTQEVYDFCRRHAGRRWWAIRGSPKPGHPIVPPFPSKSARGRYHIIGTESAKDWIFEKLKIRKPGPGYCHFPEIYSEEYFKGLFSEEKKYKYRNGFKVGYYEKTRRRNEPLDCRVYNVAAFHILKPNLKEIARKLGQKQKQVTETVQTIDQKDEIVPPVIPEEKKPAVKKKVRSGVRKLGVIGRKRL